MNSDENEKINIVMKKGHFHPPIGRDAVLDNYINCLQKYPLEDNIRNYRGNLNANEKQALDKLKAEESIIIKEADKGGGIVIMNKDFYCKNILLMLEDASTYKETSANPDMKIMKELRKLVDRGDTGLTKAELDFILNFETSTSNLYGLPKIHKSKLIQNTIKNKNTNPVTLLNPEDLPFRPIVAGPNCPTSRLSNLIDIILKPLVSHVTSYIRDSTDFLTKLPTTVPNETLLATFDVVSLYTNIPHDLGLTAVKYWLDKYPDSIDQRFLCKFILEATKFILENNTFQFNDKYYFQISGTAMGTKMAPTYANTNTNTLFDIARFRIKVYHQRRFTMCIMQALK